MPRGSTHSSTLRTVWIRHAAALRLQFRRASTPISPLCHFSNHRLCKIHIREILMPLHRKRTTIRGWMLRNHPVKSILAANSVPCQRRNSPQLLRDPPCNTVTTSLHWWSKATHLARPPANTWEVALFQPALKRLGTTSSKWTMQGHSRIQD